MIVGVTASAAQVCAFALGCALIHAARAHATLVTRLLRGVAVALAVIVLLAGSLVLGRDDGTFDEITVFAAA